MREYARIQTFPDDWQFMGSMPAQYKQIGNAVPVNLAHAVGNSLMSLLKELTKPIQFIETLSPDKTAFGFAHNNVDKLTKLTKLYGNSAAINKLHEPVTEAKLKKSERS